MKSLRRPRRQLHYSSSTDHRLLFHCIVCFCSCKSYSATAGTLASLFLLFCMPINHSQAFNVLVGNAAPPTARCTLQKRLFLGKRRAPTSVQSQKNDNIYLEPSWYDTAFGYRDFEAEVDFLVSQQQSTTSHTFLELAAGPARHSQTAAARGYSVTALDNCPMMREYALEQQQGDDDVTFRYELGDMRNYSIHQTTSEKKMNDCLQLFDSAWILLGSLQHLLTTQHVLDCLERTFVHLRPSGTVILELPHPRETLGFVECTRNGWSVPWHDDDEKQGALEIVWGDEDDDIDPVEQIRHCSVSFRDTRDGRKLSQTVPMRLFTVGEIEALAAAAGFRLAKLYGALDEDVPIDNDDLAYRMVCVLEKQ